MAGLPQTWKRTFDPYLPPALHHITNHEPNGANSIWDKNAPFFFQSCSLSRLGDSVRVSQRPPCLIQKHTPTTPAQNTRRALPVGNKSWMRTPLSTALSSSSSNESKDSILPPEIVSCVDPYSVIVLRLCSAACCVTACRL